MIKRIYEFIGDECYRKKDYEIAIEEGGEGPPLKWIQIPLLNEDPNMPFTPYFMGWDEISLFGDTIIADDWFCKSPRPVTEIQWWGSYSEWDSAFIPPIAPSEFHIGIWTDVPKGEKNDWSHPGVMIWERIFQHQIDFFLYPSLQVFFLLQTWLHQNFR